jgi:hypothetical protein
MLLVFQFKKIVRSKPLDPVHKQIINNVSICRFLITINGDELDARLYWLNFFALFVVLIAKLPKLHRVRIFGINAE